MHFPRKYPAKQLADYQQKAKENLLPRLLVSGGKAILRMPTGTGKTRTAMDVVYNWLDVQKGQCQKAICIWIAHTEELCEQALEEVEELYRTSPANYSLDTFRMWGAYSTKNKEHTSEVLERMMDLNYNCVFVATTSQTLLSVLESSEEYQWLQSAFEGAKVLLVIDEAHRAAAPTYERVIECVSNWSNRLSLLGLTATPRRMSGTVNEEAATESLLSMFGGSEGVIDPFASPDNLEKIAGFAVNQSLNGDWNYRSYLIGRGILARPRFHQIETEFEVDEAVSGDFLHELAQSEEISQERITAIDNVLAELLNSHARRKKIVTSIADIARRGQTLVFSATQKDADLSAWLLRKMGIRAESVHSSIKARTRRKRIDDFREGRIDVLCNCTILTTGFDHPGIKNVVVARPTISTVLYEQMIGRGLRGTAFNGTSECDIYNVIDKLPDAIEERLAHHVINKIWESDINTLRSRATIIDDITPGLIPNVHNTNPIQETKLILVSDIKHEERPRQKLVSVTSTVSSLDFIPRIRKLFAWLQENNKQLTIDDRLNARAIDKILRLPDAKYRNVFFDDPNKSLRKLFERAFSLGYREFSSFGAFADFNQASHKKAA